MKIIVLIVVITLLTLSGFKINNMENEYHTMSKIVATHNAIGIGLFHRQIVGGIMDEELTVSGNMDNILLIFKYSVGKTKEEQFVFVFNNPKWKKLAISYIKIVKKNTADYDELRLKHLSLINKIEDINDSIIIGNYFDVMNYKLTLVNLDEY